MSFLQHRGNTGRRIRQLRGRVNYSASGLAGRRNPNSPYGVLVLEEMGLSRRPASFVQIANIPENGLSSLDQA